VLDIFLFLNLGWKGEAVDFLQVLASSCLSASSFGLRKWRSSPYKKGVDRPAMIGFDGPPAAAVMPIATDEPSFGLLRRSPTQFANRRQPATGVIAINGQNVAGGGGTYWILEGRNGGYADELVIDNFKNCVRKIQRKYLKRTGNKRFLFKNLYCEYAKIFQNGRNQQLTSSY
jgi:hypothetical protein